jgi:hypothetical protein
MYVFVRRWRLRFSPASRAIGNAFVTDAEIASVDERDRSCGHEHRSLALGTGNGPADELCSRARAYHGTLYAIWTRR